MATNDPVIWVFPILIRAHSETVVSGWTLPSPLRREWFFNYYLIGTRWRVPMEQSALRLGCDGPVLMTAIREWVRCHSPEVPCAPVAASAELTSMRALSPGPESARLLTTGTGRRVSPHCCGGQWHVFYVFNGSSAAIFFKSDQNLNVDNSTNFHHENNNNDNHKNSLLIIISDKT